jgi:glycosyltransferase involved in cell wall biosynthesis
MSTPIHIIHIIGSGKCGGAERFVHQLARTQQQIDRDLRVTIGYRQMSGWFSTQDFGDINRCHCPDIRSVRAFIRQIQAFRQYDLVFFHGAYCLHFFAAMLSGRAVLYFMHGNRLNSPPVRQTVRTTIRSGKRFSRKGLRRRIRKVCYVAFLKWGARRVYVPSMSFAAIARRRYFLTASRLLVQPLGIDPASYRTSDTEPVNNMNVEKACQIGCVAGLRRVKRIDRLIRAFHTLVIDHPDLDTTLVIIGDGKERDTLEKQVTVLDLNDRIHFTGQIQDIGDYYPRLDILVLPSEVESFSLVVAEAMWFGIPSVAFSSSGGPADLISAAGLQTLVRDERELSEHLYHLVSNPSFRHHQSRKASHYARKSLHIGNVARRLNRHLKEILAS